MRLQAADNHLKAVLSAAAAVACDEDVPQLQTLLAPGRIGAGRFEAAGMAMLIAPAVMQGTSATLSLSNLQLK